ncbi:MAG: glycosyltransferase family 2 protein [Marinicaulis sp.]|nr:glycosyltransferase family 2 protein [Marinicaulis sp.]
MTARDTIKSLEEAFAGGVRKAHPRLSIIAPCYNEAATIDAFYYALKTVLGDLSLTPEIIFVDDGSEDETRAKLARFADKDALVKALFLSRNFGKEAAMSAGLDHATGDAVIVIDTDLQDPPEVIPEFVEKWREGFDVVYGKRVDRQSDTFLKRFTAGKFYSLFNSMSGVKIPENTGDFRLMDRRVVEAIKQLPERSRFMKGLFAWVGYNSTAVEYVRPERNAGSSKFNYWKLWNFALDGFVSFSSAPLRVWSYVGAVVASFAFLYATAIIISVLLTGIDLPGYASLLTFVLFLGGVQILSIGVLGEYISRLFIEVKQRPVYIVDRVIESSKAKPHAINGDAAADLAQNEASGAA